jgi:TonB family protein
MTQRSAAKVGFLKKLLLVAIGTGAVAGHIVAGLIKAPAATAQATRVHTDPPLMMMGIASHHVADSQQIYHVGGDVTPPKLIYAPDPEFTEAARRAKYQGVCVISTVVNAQGNPTQVQVERRLGMGLDKKAVEAVKQYRFTPAMRLGSPVAVQVRIEVNFRSF